MTNNLSHKEVEAEKKASLFVFGGLFALVLGGIAIWYGYNSIKKQDSKGIDLTKNLLKSTENVYGSLNSSLNYH